MPQGVACAGLIALVAAGINSESAAACESSSLLFGLAILVLGVNLGGLSGERFGQPSVLGELLFGIVLANLSPLISGDGGD